MSNDKNSSDENEEKGSERERGLGDVFKKVLASGLSAAFMTEDAVKKITSDLPLPKEIVNGLLSNAKATKKEFVSGVKKEFKSYLDRFDVSKEVNRILENYDVEVKANIKFKKKNK